jgi:hypothetical protein
VKEERFPSRPGTVLFSFVPLGSCGQGKLLRQLLQLHLPQRRIRCGGDCGPASLGEERGWGGAGRKTVARAGTQVVLTLNLGFRHLINQFDGIVFVLYPDISSKIGQLAFRIL